MINVLKKQNEITVSGHAGYDQSGKDIVCAAVSTAIIVTVNALDKLDVLNHITYEMKEGYFKLLVKNNNNVVNALVENLEYTLSDLKKQYPKYIKIKKEG